LQNRLYRGEIVHKGQSHPGEHMPIIDQLLWNAVQAQLAANTAERNSGTRTRQPTLLAGMLFDGDGNRMTPTYATKKGRRYRYYVSRPLISNDQAVGSTALRVPAGEIEQAVTSRLRQWLVDPGSVYQATRFADPSAQRQLIARAEEIGKSWPELPATRQRILLAALIECIEVRANRIDIHLRPARLGALLDIAATPLSGATDDEIRILSVPIELRCSARGMKVLIEGTDPFATAKPDARLIKLLIRARRFNASLIDSDGVPFCGTRQAPGREPVLFHAARPPKLSRPGHHSSHPRRAPAARSDCRQAAGAFASAAHLAPATDSARLRLTRLSQDWLRRAAELSHLGPHHSHCGTGI
jgi:hypothetical protein